MRKVIAIVAGLLIVAGTVLVGTETSQANPTPRHTLKNPLSITGSVVAGVTSVQPGQVLTFDFTIKNHRSASVDVDFDFTWAHANEVGITCPLVSSGADINPDSPFCEPGALARGGTTQAAIVVRAPNSAGTVVVKACADDEDNGATPPCSSVSVPDVG